MEKRLYKSPDNKVLAGVCGGIGEYFNVDPVIIRLLVVVFTLMGGAGLIAYIIAAIIIPGREDSVSSDYYQNTYGNEEGQDGSAGKYAQIKSNGNAALVLGLILIGLAGLMILRFFVPWIPRELIFAAILIAIGLYLITRRK